MDIDWKKASSGQKEVFPAGPYHVIVDSWERGGKSKAGNKMIKIVSRILDGEHKGKTVDDWITLTEASMWRLAAFLGNCLSFDVSTLPPMQTESQEFDNLLNACVGRKFWINLFVDTFEGSTKNKTTQKDPYAPDKNNKPFDPTVVEDVPDWVKGEPDIVA